MKRSLLLALGALAARPLLAADPALAASSVNGVGLELFRSLAKDNANLCLSPYSIQCALAMTYAGAGGATAAEMGKALQFPADAEAVADSFSALAAGLDDARAKSAKRAQQSKFTGGPSEPIVLGVANRLFGQQGSGFEKPFLQLLETKWLSPLEELNFAKNPDVSRIHINDWVKQQTHDRIRDLLPPSAINGATQLVLANALYLKAPWSEAFVENATQPRPFHVAGGTAVDVPTMSRKLTLGYVEGSGFTAVSLPYSGGDLQFLIVLPEKADGLAALTAKLSPHELSGFAKMAWREAIVHLPKFKFESPSIPLRGPLEKLGLSTVFDQPHGSANFDKIAPRRPDSYIYISEVFHKTFIAVDERGTEAAAATAVVALAGAAMRPEKPLEISIDRPFLFAIQHVPSGACLFLGQVADPR